MITVKKEGIILSKTDLVFENEGVLNPAIINEGNTVHLFYRAVRKGNNSTIGYCRLEGPLTVKERKALPVIIPSTIYEIQGVEDPRLVKIDDLYYMSYSAFDGVNALGAVATSTDLIHWDKRGLVVPEITYHEFNRLTSANNKINEKYLRYNALWDGHEKEGVKLLIWDKNVIFFPRRINNKLYFLHRIRPEIQLVCVNELSELTPEFWQNYFLHLDEWIVLSPTVNHEICYIGGGCPPIETKEGWILIYHGVRDSPQGNVYSACVALLDLNNPQKEIARLPYALFKPEFEWEIHGVVDNVCFPTGTALFDDTIYIYYGAADIQIACASLSLSALLTELLLNKK